MYDSEFAGTDHLDQQLCRLSQKVSQEESVSHTTLLTRALNHIATAEPFVAAGAYLVDPESNQSHWIARDEANICEALLDQLLERHSDRLALAARGSGPIQQEIETPDQCRETARVIAAAAAGLIHDARSGLVYVSRRALSESELVQLEPFSRFVGALVENSRVAGIARQSGARSPFAQLIGLIAHELRTPLTGMRGNIQLALMSNRKGQHDRVPQRLQAAIDTVDQMAGIVKNLLDVSRLERGEYPFQESNADLRATMLAAIEDTHSQASLESLRINLADGESIRYQHDQSAMQQCISYLLQAVARYISESGEVTVAVSQQGDDRQIVISYPGEALSESDRSALSEPLDERYERSKRDLSRDELSLELAFSRGIVQRHQGKIAFGSSETPPGTQLITVTLPASSQ